MGVLFFVCCPCMRVYYDPSRGDELLTEEERKEKERRLAEARRKAELRVKNPETAEWKNFQAKFDPEKGGNEEAFVEKIEKTEKARRERNCSRADRRAARAADEDFIVKVKMPGDV